MFDGFFSGRWLKIGCLSGVVVIVKVWNVVIWAVVVVVVAVVISSIRVRFVRWLVVRLFKLVVVLMIKRRGVVVFSVRLRTICVGQTVGFSG